MTLARDEGLDYYHEVMPLLRALTLFLVAWCDKFP
jgi:hypothetical protein